MEERRWPFSLLHIAIGWLLLAGLLSIQLWPDLPKSKAQWVFFIFFAPPLYVLGEAFFGWILSRKHGKAISKKQFSILRVMIALPIVLAVFALSWWLTWLLSR